MPTKTRRPDRRVLRTRRAIMEAFERLVARSSVDKITVSALAREADIDRKTFYLHFSSISDLVNRRTEADLERILRALGDAPPDSASGPAGNAHVILTEVNAILMENLVVYQNMASHLSLDQILELFERSTLPFLARVGIDLGADDKRGLRMNLRFYVAGALSLYTAWLVSDHATPIEEVSAAVEDAMRTGPASLLQDVPA